jgi:L-fuculose-phosphate aldolase
LRLALARVARALDSAGLNHGHAGNVSVRDGAGMLITPSGIDAASLHATSMVAMSLDGAVAGARHEPSSEWRLHAAVYAARADLGAVVHAHPPYATALACVRRAIPAFHYTVALSGAAQIPCAGYATFGSPQLADAVLGALGTHGRACLMANHGMLAAGADLNGALLLAREVEFLAQVYWLSLQAGSPELLDTAEMERVSERMRGYGRQQ